MKHRDELFKRIKPLQLAALLNAGIGSSPPLTPLGEEEKGPGGGGGGGGAGGAPAPGASPCLVVDLRDAGAYDACHIHTAVSFPARYLLQDRLTAEVFAARNRDNVVIVAYDADERAAPQAVNLFMQKGFENVVLLTGGARATRAALVLLLWAGTNAPPPPPPPRAPAGLKAFVARCGALVEGDVPAELLGSSGARDSSSTASVAMSGRSYAASRAMAPPSPREDGGGDGGSFSPEPARMGRTVGGSSSVRTGATGRLTHRRYLGGGAFKHDDSPEKPAVWRPVA